VHGKFLTNDQFKTRADKEKFLRLTQEKPLPKQIQAAHARKDRL
jgi:hypothetical protein